MDEAKLLTDLQGEDELGTVIRGHIHVEAQILRLLEVLVPYPEHLKKVKLDYAQKVQLTVAMGLKPEQAASLNMLGSIRNRFAHKLERNLTKSDADNLYKSLEAEAKTLVQEAFELTNNQLSSDKSTKFKHLSPRDQFVLIVIALQQMLLRDIDEAKKRASSA
jgi:hypothetical protein